MTRADLGTLCVCAVRYALGRQTYIVGEVTDIVRTHYQHLTEYDRLTILKDIRNALDTGRVGDPTIDRPCWQALHDFLETRIDELVTPL